jgi:hypothetical protein
MSKKTDHSNREIQQRDPDFIKAEAAMKRAAQRARKRARQALVWFFRRTEKLLKSI